MTTDELFEKINNVMLSKQDVISELELFAKEAHNQAIKEAAEAAQVPYLENGMTNLANRAKQAILNLLKP